MRITDEMVDHLAHLSRLQFSVEEKQSFKDDLEKMVSFVEKLKEVDTANIQPLLHMGDASNVLREDIIQGSVSSEEALLNAPQQDGQFIQVPKVIKK